MKTTKGFTLIELMVVIVIIGILAAIAIPKLFGMSAKAKAQEVPGAAGTWTKLQSAYIVEKAEIGTNQSIAYKFPGQDSYGQTGSSPGFNYGVTFTGTTGASWTASPKNALNDCKTGSKWTATINTDMSVGATGDGDCLTLTPNFINLK